MHIRLGDEHVRGWKALDDVGEDVTLRSRVVPGDDADQLRKARQSALPALVEEPFGGELRLQPFECREVRAEAEPLDRQGLQPKLASLLEQLGAAEHVHALTLGEVELQSVELPTRHLHRQGCSRPRGPSV